MRKQTPFLRLSSSFVNVQMLVVLFWLLCVLFVNISSHLLVFFVLILLKLLFATLTRSIDASTDCLHVCVVFLFCFICLLFCNCIFLTKNKEITLELYFFFVLLCIPSVFYGGAVSFALFECCFYFYLLLPRRILVLLLTTSLNASWFFICLFLIKDTVNYFLTFLYSCSWIVLLCEFVGVCCRRWPFYGKRKKCRWKTKRKKRKI